MTISVSRYKYLMDNYGNCRMEKHAKGEWVKWEEIIEYNEQQEARHGGEGMGSTVSESKE